MNSEPCAAPAAAPDGVLPRWAGKPVRRLTTGELAEALEYLERHRPDDEVLGRALAGEFARRTAAAEAASEFADRTTTGPTTIDLTTTGRVGSGPATASPTSIDRATTGPATTGRVGAGRPVA